MSVFLTCKNSRSQLSCVLLQGETSVWGKLTKEMYGEFSDLLKRRMFTAWRRKRAGSVRDRVLSSLRSEGMYQVPLSTEISEPQCKMDSDTAASVENHTDARCCRLTSSENVVQRDTSGEARNGTPEYRKNKVVNNCSMDKNHCRVITNRYIHRNNSEYVRVRRSAVSSYSLKGMCNCVFVTL